MPSPKKSTKTTKGSASQIQTTRVISKPITQEELLNSAGVSGTYIVNGFLESDYNSKLSGIEGLEKYDEMRKADAQVRASLMVCMLPLLSTEWYFDAATNPDTGEVGEDEQMVADFCTKALFEKMDVSWTQHLTDVLTMLPFGFSLFEKVYTADEEDDYIWLKELGHRKQKTIYKWEQEDGSAGVVQQLPSMIQDIEHPNYGKNRVDIPAAKLLLFSFQKEGDNYAGVSVLRSAYKHWYMKEVLYKFDAIHHERQSVGIPYIKLPKGASPKDKEEARAILKNIRANEQGGILLPNPTWECGFLDLQARQTSDVWKSIEHHSMMIAKNVLAMFMELASGDGGSRALSEDQSDFFLLSEEAVANLIEDVYNRHLIPELVDLNFEVTDYPKLRHRKLGSVDYSTISTVVSSLVGSGVIEVDEDLEEWMRNLIDAPKKVTPEEEAIEGEPEDQQIDPTTGLPIDPNVDPTTGLPIDPATGLPMDPNIQNTQAVPLTPEEQAQADAAQATLDNQSATAEELEVAANLFIALSEKSYGFRIVSEETKKKISDALKARNGGGKGNVIAQRRDARLARAGKRVTPKSGAATMQKIKDALNQVGTNSAKTPMKKTSKLGHALKKIAIHQKMKGKGGKGKKAKGAKASKKKVSTPSKVAPKASKVTPPKPAAKAPAPKAAAPTPKATALTKSAALRKSVRVAKKVHAHEETEYERIFSETAKSVLIAQRSIPPLVGAPVPKSREFKENSYQSWRPLTFAENKVNWTSIGKTMDQFKAALDSELDSITKDQKADILSQVQRAVEGNDIAAVGQIKAKYVGDLSSALTNVQKEMFEAGKTAAALEMGVKSPPTAREVMGALKVGNDKLVEKLTNDMSNAASLAVTQTVSKKGGLISGTGTADAVSAASEAIDKVLEAKARLHTLTLMGSLNLGRASIFERYPEQIYGFQFSAIIDENTTDTCLSLDGRVVLSGSSDFYSYSPPLHYNCRSIWVEILQDEEYKPEADDIPNRIPTSQTIDGFEDLEAPVIQPNSPAMKIIQDEIDQRKAQVETYQKNDQFPNRVESHQARIDSLENALKKA